MTIKDLVKYDLRKSYLTDEQLSFWNENNSLFNTLWFDVNIGGPDVEFSYIAQKLFTINKTYDSYSIVPKKPAGYALMSPKGNIITSDVMSGRWEFIKRLMASGDCNKRDRDILTKSFLDGIKEFRLDKGDVLYRKLVNKYGHDIDTWKSLLSYLDIAYTIGNMTPAGANPGGNGYDNWITKLNLLYNEYFFGPPKNEKSIIYKWKPILVEKYKINDERNNCKERWKNFIEDNFFQPFVDENLTVKNIDFTDLKSSIETTENMILSRARLIENDSNYANRQYELISIPFGSIKVTDLR